MYQTDGSCQYFQFNQINDIIINKLQQMLNLALKKVHTLLVKRSIFRNSGYNPLHDAWFELDEEPKDKVTIQQHSSTSHWNPSNIFGSSDKDALHKFHPSSSSFLKPASSEITKQTRNEKKKIVNQKQVPEIDRNMDLIFGSASKTKTQCFSRSIVNVSTKMSNAQKVVDTISTVLKQNQKKQFLNLIRNFVASERFVEGEIPEKPNQKEKQFFKKISQLLLRSIMDPILTREITKLLSETNPNFIPVREVSRSNEIQKSVFEATQRKISKMDLFGASFNDSLMEDKISKIKQSESLELINSITKKGGHKMRTSEMKLFLKKQQQKSELIPNQANLVKVERKIFGNKKLVTDHIIYKRTETKSNEKYNSYGENWIYAYELPYSLTNELAELIIGTISQKYGPIVDYYGESYENFVEKSKNQTIYVLPDDFRNDGKGNKVKINKIQAQNLHKSNNDNGKKSIVNKILQKSKNTKELALNKSTLVFKFKNKADKIKFLSPEMRLYGLCLEKIRNIRFEQAQSKNVVALSMIPWACESADLLKFINDSLVPLNITITHPNCIIAKGYVFLEMANFYEAFQSKDLLNNLVFQNQRLKAQLCYGSSFVYEGKYKHHFENDHYQELVRKLLTIRSQFSDMIR